jgi:hypothetical protein
MKKIFFGFLLGSAVLATSCKKYLDVNDNPNSATSATPELILPQAVTSTASLLSGYNNYGSQTGLYSANAGGYGGFGESITYNYTTTGSGLFNATYDNLEDYQTILNKTDGDTAYAYFNAAARIMRAYDFQLLVDAFNDVPYTDALKGGDLLSPTYDAGKDIYKDLATQLDKAIEDIDAVDGLPGIKPLSSSDIIFEGDVDLWKQLANTIKLRLIIRASAKVDFANSSFSPDGFLTQDALINPGYTKDNGKQNPAWNTWAFSPTGTAANKAWMPSQFIFGFYNGATLSDDARGRAIYYQYPNTGINRLGIESNSLVSSPTGGFWYVGTDAEREAGNVGGQAGILKGPDAGYPLMLASESYFLQAEGALKGLISTGTPSEYFDNGISASFNYSYQLPDGTVPATIKIPSKLDPTKDSTVDVKLADTITTYKSKNSGNYLVNFSLAASTEQKLEAIITQKIIALNFIHGHEAFNEYRRTHYPKITPGSGFTTFASSVSESTRPDKLPTRILYPTSEGSYNGANVPKNISPFTSLIFWAE